MSDDNNIKKIWDVQVEILDKIVEICNRHELRYYLIYGTLLGAVRHKGFIPWDDDLDIIMPRKDYEVFIEAALEELPSEYFLQNDNTEDGYWLNFSKVRKNNTLFIEASEKIMGDNIHKGIFVDIFPLDCTKKPDGFVQHVEAVLIKAISETRYLKKGILTESSMKYNKVDKILKLFSHRILSKWYVRLTKHKEEQCENYVDWFTNRSYTDSIYPKSWFGDGIKMKFMDKEYIVPEEYDLLLTKEYGDYMTLPKEEDRVMHRTTEVIFDIEEGR